MIFCTPQNDVKEAKGVKCIVIMSVCLQRVAVIPSVLSATSVVTSRLACVAVNDLSQEITAIGVT